MCQLHCLQLGAARPVHPAEVQAVQDCPVLWHRLPGRALEGLPQETLQGACCYQGGLEVG